MSALSPQIEEGDPIRGSSAGWHFDDVLVIRDIRECNSKLGKVFKFQSDDRMIFTGFPNEINFHIHLFPLIALRPDQHSHHRGRVSAKCAAGHLLPSHFA